MGAPPEVGMSFAHANTGKDPTETEVRALMKVLIGVDPHKGSVAIAVVDEAMGELDRKSTRLNSSHANISYAVFCLKKKKYRFFGFLILVRVQRDWTSIHLN